MALWPLWKDRPQPISRTVMAVLEMSGDALGHFATPRQVRILLGTSLCWLSPIDPLLLEQSPLFPAVPSHHHGKADGPSTVLCQGQAEAAQGSAWAASVTAVQPTGRDGADSGLPRSSRKGRPERRRMQSLEQRSLLCRVPEPCGATNILCL